MPRAKPKIYFFNTEKWEQQYLAEKLKGLPVTFLQKKLTARSAKQFSDAEIISVFIYSQVSKAVLDQLPELKLIATRSTGFDHIDLRECSRRGIKVANVPYYGENTIAEHTFALLLTLSRKIYQAYTRVQKLDYDYRGLRGMDLQHKVLGIIGCGHIGQHVVRIAKGFEMEVLAYDIYRDLKLAKKLGFSYVKSLDELLKKSDVISLHAPYNNKTHHLINKQNIKRIKKGALLINTARGGLVDTNVLVWALDKKIIAGAGLDVLEEECVIKEEHEILSKDFPKECNLKTVLLNHALIARDNVIVTPHMAFNTQEAIERIIDTTVENIKSFLKR